MISLTVALVLVMVFSVVGRVGMGSADTLPSGERTFGQTVIEPAYDSGPGTLVYLQTPMHTHVNPNEHNVAPLYLPMYPAGAPVGTLNCEDLPAENCPDHGPLLAGLAESVMPSVYGGGVLGHDHLAGIASSGGDFNVLWEPVVLLFTNSWVANHVHITTLAQVKWALSSGNAIPIPLPQATFHCSVVSGSAYAHGVPFTG
jgi:hypothetical protein